MKTIRIACGQGFWGDSETAAIDLVQKGPIDYLVLDYLAEVTMSILARHRAKNPALGYARDFVDLIDKISNDIVTKKIKVIANSGGVNPKACAEAVKLVLEKKNLQNKIKIAVVEGDDILSEIDSLIQKKENFKNLDNNQEFSAVKANIKSANVYLGCSSVVSALREDATIVITGRVADPCMVLAPMIKEFNWKTDDWDKLASGIVAGHIIECGAQCSGGNFSFSNLEAKDLVDIGYPIIEAKENGEFVVTKHDNTAGLVSEESIKEQLIYEIGDPKNYITPDVVADFTTIKLREIEKNRVLISGIKGKERPEHLKVSFSYFNGYTASGSLVYSWPNAVKKANSAAEIVQKRLEKKKIFLKKYSHQLIGVNACHNNSFNYEASEVMLRIVASDPNKNNLEAFTKEIVPLVLNGPSSVTGYFSSKGKVLEEIAYWPSLIKRENVKERYFFV